MQVGVQDLAGTQHGAFHWLRLFHLHDHFGAGKNVGGSGHQLGSGGLVLGILQTDGGAGIVLHQHLVTVGNEFTYACRCQTDAKLVVLDFLGDSDQHGTISWFCKRNAIVRNSPKISSFMT